MEHLPHEIKEQIIQCFGKCFHYKDTMESFLISLGVSNEIARKYRDEPKFVWARKLLNDLSETEQGRIIQRKIVTELCKLRNLPDSDVLDREGGLDRLRTLKDLAVKHTIYIEEKRKDIQEKKNIAQAKLKIIEERNIKLAELRKRFYNGIKGADRQAIGYDLDFSCKGKCDFILRNDFRKKGFFDGGWMDIEDLKIPTQYLIKSISYFNRLYRYNYLPNAHEKLKKILIGIFPYVSRDLTAKEKSRLKVLLESNFI